MKLMHSAARTGNIDQMQDLIGVYKRIVLARDDEGAQPLHVAVRAGNSSEGNSKHFPSRSCCA